MGLKSGLPAGATPLDPDAVAGLIPNHITTQEQLNEWEYANVARGEEWAFGAIRRDMFTIEFLQQLHRKMFGDTWNWAGVFRTREVQPVGSAPENIRPDLSVLLGNTNVQIRHRSWNPEEIAARFHHRLVQIHPFPNGNGRFARTMTDLLLHRSGHARFSWGEGLDRTGDARERYIAALRAADGRDFGPLLALLSPAASTNPPRR